MTPTEEEIVNLKRELNGLIPLRDVVAMYWPNSEKHKQITIDTEKRIKFIKAKLIVLGDQTK